MIGSAIGGLAGGVFSALGGSKEADAASDAAQAQVEAAREAAATQKRLFGISRADLAPQRTQGYLAGYYLDDALGIPRPQLPVNQLIDPRIALPPGDISLTQEYGGTGTNRSSGPTTTTISGNLSAPALTGSGGGGGDYTPADYGLGADQLQAVLQSNQVPAWFLLGMEKYQTDTGTDLSGAIENFNKGNFNPDSNTNINPFALNSSLTPLNNLAYNVNITQSGGGGQQNGLLPTTVPYGVTDSKTVQDRFRSTPGYQFALEEGNRRIQANQAALGYTTSGAAGKELLRYGQGFADQRYQQYVNNLAMRAGYGNAAAANSAASAQNFGTNLATNQLMQGNAQAGGIAASGAASSNAYKDFGAGISRGLSNLNFNNLFSASPGSYMPSNLNTAGLNYGGGVASYSTPSSFNFGGLI